MGIIDKPIFRKLSFSQWFGLRRDIVKLTQTQIATKIGVKRTTISNWEKGFSNPHLNPGQTRVLCDLLNTNVEQLANAFRGEIEISDLVTEIALIEEINQC